MTDREQAGLRGPVRTCAAECDYAYPDRSWVMQTTQTFSERGDLLGQHHLNPDGSKWSIMCRFDDHGRKLEMEHRGTQGDYLLVYDYDALGRLERVTVRSETGTERIWESYRYDSGGQKMATVYPDPAFRAKANVVVDAAVAFEISSDASSILTIFDENDRPVKRVFYDPNGMVDRRILLRYDAAGRLVEEGEFEADGIIRPDLRHIYDYDAEGRIIEKTMYHHAFGTHRKTLVYNAQGDIVEERNQRTAGLIEEFGEREWKTRYRYQYDGRGNWVERVTETVLPSGESTVSMIERRTFDYY